MDFCVYVLTNTVNHKRYVGICRGAAARRFQAHRRNASRRGARGKLASALRKYGPEAFTCEEIARVATWENACAMERKLIAEWRLMETGYNMTGGGEGVYDPSPEVRAKMRVSSRGRLLPFIQSPEGRAHILTQCHANNAKRAADAAARKAAHVFKHSEETRRKLSEAAKRRVQTPEGQAQLRAAVARRIEARRPK